MITFFVLILLHTISKLGLYGLLYILTHSLEGFTIFFLATFLISQNFNLLDITYGCYLSVMNSTMDLLKMCWKDNLVGFVASVFIWIEVHNACVQYKKFSVFYVITVKGRITAPMLYCTYVWRLKKVETKPLHFWIYP